MTTHTITEKTTLVTETCCNCYVVFAMTSAFRKARLDDHALFYCPAGHPQHYTGQSEAEKARDELERTRRLLDSERSWSSHLDRQLSTTKKTLASTKGQLTKTKNRVAKGVCPCCRRPFVNLQRHMAGQHPTYAEESNG